MKQSSNSRRVNESARMRIADILLYEIADPRVQLVTVTGCEVSLDRSLCRVYISAEKERYDEVREGLESCKKRIRYLFGQGLDWRVTPELEFVIDTTTDEAERIAVALQNVPATLAIPKDEDGYPIEPVEDGDISDDEDADA